MNKPVDFGAIYDEVTARSSRAPNAPAPPASAGDRSSVDFGKIYEQIVPPPAPTPPPKPGMMERARGALDAVTTALRTRPTADAAGDAAAAGGPEEPPKPSAPPAPTAAPRDPGAPRRGGTRAEMAQPYTARGGDTDIAGEPVEEPIAGRVKTLRTPQSMGRSSWADHEAYAPARKALEAVPSAQRADYIAKADLPPWMRSVMEGAALDLRLEEESGKRKPVRGNLLDEDLTVKHVVGAVSGGVEDVKALGSGAAAMPSALRYGANTRLMEDMDAIDQGRAPASRQGKSLAGGGVARAGDQADLYRKANPEQRQQLRQQAMDAMKKDEQFLQWAAAKVKEYQEQSAKEKGRIPDFTDARTVDDFTKWAVLNGAATAPTMAVTMLGALAGMPGLLAASGAMAAGDLTSKRLEFAADVSDPKRFRSADRATDAMAAQPGQIARHAGANAGRDALLVAPYMALDILGPEAMLAKRTLMNASGLGAGAAAKKIGVGTAGEAFGEGGQEVVNVAGEMGARERPLTWTDEDSKRVFNSAMVGALMGAGSTSAAVALDFATGPLRNSAVQRELERRAADGDIQAAVTLQISQAGNIAPRDVLKMSTEAFEQAAAAFGVAPDAVKAAVQRASAKPADEAPGYLSRVLQALGRRGLTARPVPPSRSSETIEPEPFAPTMPMGDQPAEQGPVATSPQRAEPPARRGTEDDALDAEQWLGAPIDWHTEQPQPGDLTTADGMPYGSRAAAHARANKDGGEIVPVAGGWVVRPSRPLESEPQVDQAVGDRVLADAKLFGDGPSAQAALSKGFQSLDRDRQHVVLSHVMRSLDDEKVLRAVVQAVPVDVMNLLVGRQAPSDSLLGDKSVLTSRLSVPRNVPVPQPVLAVVDALASSIKRGSALGAAKDALVNTGGGALSHNTDSAPKTERGDGRHAGNYLKGASGQQHDLAVPAEVAPGPGAGGSDLAGRGGQDVGRGPADDRADPGGAGQPDSSLRPSAGLPGTQPDVGGGGTPSALSDEPDFATTFPAPRFADLAAAGRQSAFDGLDGRDLEGAVRAIHDEVAATARMHLAAARAIRAGIESGTDPETGKPATADRIAALAKEWRGQIDIIDGAFAEYASEFGQDRADAFQKLVVPDLDIARNPPQVDEEPVAAPATKSKRADALKKLGGILGAQPAPAAAAPESAASPEGERDGQEGQGLRGRQEEVAQPEQGAAPVPSGSSAEAAPAAPTEKKVRKTINRGHPKTVNGSRLLAEISRQLGGLDPSLIPDLSVRRETGLKDRYGRPVTAWVNPGIKYVGGGLFREGGVADTNELAQWMETEGYIPPGTYERNYTEADEMARSMVRSALERVEPKTRDEQEADEQARRDEEADAYYAALDEEAAAEAERERLAIMAEADLTAAEMDALTDEDVAIDGPASRPGSTAEIMRALGFTEQEIADEVAREQARGADRPEAGDGAAEAGQDADGAPREPAAPGAPAPQPADGQPAQTLTAERIAADIAIPGVLDGEAPLLARALGINPDGLSPAEIRALLLAADPARAVDELNALRGAALLAPQTEADLRARAAREAAAAAADAAEQRRLANKAAADAALGEFTLTGSDRPADVGAAAGQVDLFGSPEPAGRPDNARTARDAALIAARKRVAGLKALRDCLLRGAA